VCCFLCFLFVLGFWVWGGGRGWGGGGGGGVDMPCGIARVGRGCVDRVRGSVHAWPRGLGLGGWVELAGCGDGGSLLLISGDYKSNCQLWVLRLSCSSLRS